MDRCEICGRHPAKRMTFKAHQGFIIFRREFEISGVFCRDHAFEAYAAAQGKNLAGMWFSPESLLFGPLRLLWDSTKLLDLPAEVTDAPFVPHKIGCPKCQQAHIAVAGPITCTTCGTVIVIASCEKCQTVHTVATDQPYDAVTIKSCRNCSHRTPAPFAARNSPIQLLAFSITEIVGCVANVDGFVDPLILKEYVDTLESLFTFEKRTLACLKNYYLRCVEVPALGILLSCKEQGQAEFFQYALAVSVTILMVDGAMERESITAIREIASRLGLADCLDELLDANDPGQPDHELRPSEPWWEVLAVNPDADSAAIQAAYFALARQFHPDLWHAKSEEEQRAAQMRMKAINAAFEQARSTSGRQSATDEAVRADAKRRKAARRAAAKAAAEAEAARQKADLANSVNEKRQTSRSKKARLRLWALGATAFVAIVVGLEIEGFLRRPNRISVVPLPADADQGTTEGDKTTAKQKSEEDSTKQLHENDAREKEAEKLAKYGIELAKEHRAQGEYGSAIAALSMSITHRETYEAHSIRAFCYAKLNRYDDAESDFSACIRLQSLSATATSRAVDYNNRGSARIWLHDLDGAIADCSAALERDPGYADAYGCRGVARYQKGQYELAIDDFTTAIRLASDSTTLTQPQQTGSVLQQKIAQMYRDRASAYRAIGRYKEADSDEKNANVWGGNTSSGQKRG